MRKLRLLSLVKVGGGGGGLASLLLLLFLSSCLLSLSEAKRSACWRYGHSCWGGHGKRSGGLHPQQYPEIEPRPGPGPLLGPGGFGLVVNKGHHPSSQRVIVPSRVIPLLLRGLVMANGMSNQEAPNRGGERGQLEGMEGPPPQFLASRLLRKVKREEERDDSGGQEYEGSQQEGGGETEERGGGGGGGGKVGESMEPTFTSGGTLADSSIFVRDRKSISGSESEVSDDLSSYPIL